MTTPVDPRDLSRINPSPTVHTQPPERPYLRRLTSRQVGVIGTVIVDLILAQVALALGGIDVLGFKPFGFLTLWGQEVQKRAADAYNKAMASEAIANSSDANTAIALGQVATTQGQLQTTNLNVQTTWNSLWEASTNQILGPGQNKTIADVKTGQTTVRSIAVQGATGAVNNGVNIQGTWNSIYNGAYNTSLSNVDLPQVKSVTEVFALRAGVGETNQGILGGNIQSTWDSIYVASGGTGPSTNRSLTDAQNRLKFLNDTAYRADDNVIQGWKAYYRGILGFTIDNPTLGDVEQAADDTSDTLNDHDDRITELETVTDGGSFSGASASVLFSSYAPGALPNPPWTTTLVSGANGAGIDTSKRAAWTGTSAGRVTFIHNVQSTTDYQRVSVAVADFGLAPYYIYGRSNSTGTSAIIAKVSWVFNFSNSKYVVQLLNGSSVLKTEELNSAGVGGANPTTTLICGLKINDTNYPNKFRILIGSTIVLEYDGGSDVSSANGKYSGFGLEATGSGSSFKTTPPLSSWAMSDNLPATYLGAGIRVIRTDTTATATFAAATGGALWPAGVLSTADPFIPANADVMTYDTTTQAVTAKVSGWYMVNIGLKTAQNINTGLHYMYVGVYVNGSPHTWGPVTVYDQWTVSAVVYLNKNDYVQAAYRTNAGGFQAVGNAAGNATYLTMAFLNNTKPVNPKVATA